MREIQRNHIKACRIPAAGRNELTDVSSSTKLKTARAFYASLKTVTIIQSQLVTCELVIRRTHSRLVQVSVFA